ncbi:MAG: aminotransferase class V-fold PLP-dependent enzyme [Kiloniellales bacterium]|nr:aminotransferase class V-fold PLP-dependent enzyme [Kiloniellales bacterium]
MSASAREFLHTPGPTHIPDRVLNAMHRQPYDLSDPRFLDLADSCFRDLKGVFRTGGEVFLYASNGHGGWEAALSNLFEPGDCVLLPDVGHFSQSWGGHARAFGLEVLSPSGDRRRALDPQVVEDALRRDEAGRIKAVLAVQTDTATGITSDIQALRAAIDAAGHPALLVVDVIASLAAAPFAMDDWGVDVAIGASQKALMGPPGLAAVAVNRRAVELAAARSGHRYYWDWRIRSEREMYRRFCGTAPEHALFGLREALDILAEEGLEAVIARHARLAGVVQAAVAAWESAGALAFNAVEPAERSVSVTTVLTPEGVDGQDFRDYVRDAHDAALGGGLGTMEGRAFRIGHLGCLNAPMVLGCLAAVETALIRRSIPHGDGGLRAAVEHLAAADA